MDEMFLHHVMEDIVNLSKLGESLKSQILSNTASNPAEIFDMSKKITSIVFGKFISFSIDILIVFRTPP